MTAEPRAMTGPVFGPPCRLDVEWLRAAIYEVSVRHDWANTLDTEDRTEEIAAEYERIADSFALREPR